MIERGFKTALVPPVRLLTYYFWIRSSCVDAINDFLHFEVCIERSRFFIICFFRQFPRTTVFQFHWHGHVSISLCIHISSFNLILSTFEFQGFAIACLTLHFYSFNDRDIITSFLATGTFTGFIIVVIGVFAGESLCYCLLINLRLSNCYVFRCFNACSYT